MRTVAKLLHFPVAGVDRSLSVRNATTPREDRAYAAPFALNVRGVDALAKRLRGGSRPDFTPPMLDAGRTECRYRARLFYADGSMWYASRTDDVADFEQSGDGGDLTRPAAGNTAFAGRSGEAITALFTTDDTILFMATANTLWAMRGEPTAGPFRMLSPVVGCVSKQAWAWGGGAIYILSRQGVFAISPDSQPTCVSDGIPEELEGVSSAAMEYDADDDVLQIATDKGNWTFDIARKAWWPFDDDAESHVAIGPFRTSGRDDEDGMLDTLSVTTAEGSADVSVEVYVGGSPESAVRSAEEEPPRWSFTAQAGRNRVQRPRARGAWCVVVLRSTGVWAFESATATVKQLGRLR